MQRIRDLSRYAQILLLILVVMAIVFAVVYPVTISREGYLYREHLLIPTTENGSTIYSAEVDGEPWRITVTADKTVTFQFGDKRYGPYTAKEDPTAIPTNHNLSTQMTGVEVREGDEIVFRGGIYDVGSHWLMYDEDGTDAGSGIHTNNGNGTIVDSNGNVVDTMKPAVGTILRLLQGPKLTHRGFGFVWFVGTFCALITAVSILFADELFRFQFLFKARDPEFIEPSDWVLTIRPIGWLISVGLVFYVYMLGLK